MADCRLAAVRGISVRFAVAQVTLRASGVELEAGETARIAPGAPGPQARYQVLACAGAGGTPGGAVDVEASFPLRSARDVVIVEHAGGEKRFEAAPEVACAVCGTENPASRTYCMRCGSELGRATDVQTTARARPGNAAPPPMSAPGLPNPVGGVTRGLRNAWSRMRGVRPAEVTVADHTAPATGADEPMAEAEPPMAEAEPPMPEAEPPMPEAEPPAMAADDEPMEVEPAASDAPPAPMFPRIDAPQHALVGTPIEVTIGVSPTEDPKVGGGAMQPPPTAGEKYILSVQLIADGFSLADGSDTWEWDLAVTPHQPYPATTVTIVADPIDGPVLATRLRVLYTVDAQIIGQAERLIGIATDEQEAADVDLESGAVKRAMSVPVGATPADLTVVILMDDEVDGRLLWAFRSPHQVATPKKDRVTKIGKQPQAFADTVRKQAEQFEGTPALRTTMIGIGRDIAKSVDPEFWRLFEEVSQVVGDRPTILFLLDEPYVPWELAVLPEDRFPGEPRFLAAEAVTGRWVMTGGPKLPPPELVEMKAMAVVYGEYTTARLKALKEAEEEMQRLTQAYSATAVHATLAAVLGMFSGDPQADVLHFAIHGRFTSAGADLLMEDGQPLTATAIEGSDFPAAPFVFLNACQVGAGNELLGTYGGLVAAFTDRGASAAVAPLWSVSDIVAKDLSLHFYERAFGGERPAEILRQAREHFAADHAPQSATPMAYQFYGHPAFRLTRTEAPHG